MDLATLCHGDVRRELKITVFDYEKKGKDRWMGEVEVSVEQLVESVTRGGNACREDALALIGKKGDVVGLLVVLKADVSGCFRYLILGIVFSVKFFMNECSIVTFVPTNTIVNFSQIARVVEEDEGVSLTVSEGGGEGIEHEYSG